MAPQREWFEKDYYKVLGVSESASAKDITKAYRKLARQSPPGRQPGRPEGRGPLQGDRGRLRRARRRGAPEGVRRGAPARAVAGGFGPGGFGAGGPGGQAGGFSFDVGAEDIGDLLGNLFGGRGRRPPAGEAAGSPPSGVPTSRPSSRLDFEDAGARPHHDAPSDLRRRLLDLLGVWRQTRHIATRACRVCNGRGVVDDNQGLFSFSTPCAACQGRGVVIDDPCPTCRGSGVERRPREVKVRMPAGVADGQRIALKGRGAPGRNGGPPGDLYVTCHVTPHPLFGREGDNLTVRVPLTFAEAALGADVQVPTLEGAPVKLRIKPGTQPGLEAPRQGPGDHHQEAHRGPHRHHRRRRAGEAVRRRAPGRRRAGAGD